MRELISPEARVQTARLINRSKLATTCYTLVTLVLLMANTPLTSPRTTATTTLNKPSIPHDLPSNQPESYRALCTKELEGFSITVNEEDDPPSPGQYHLQRHRTGFN